MSRIDEIVKRLWECTLWPWVQSEPEGGIKLGLEPYGTYTAPIIFALRSGGDVCYLAPTASPQDASLIANAPSDLEYLLKELAKSQGENLELRSKLNVAEIQRDGLLESLNQHREALMWAEQNKRDALERLAAHKTQAAEPREDDFRNGDWHGR